MIAHSCRCATRSPILRGGCRNHIRAFERDQIDTGQAKQIDSVVGAIASRSRRDRKAGIFLYGLILVMNRLAAPWQLIRIATRAAESDDTARMAETPYAVAVTHCARRDRKHGRRIARLNSGPDARSRRCSRAIHDAARGLRSEMDLSVESAWSRQLAAIRAEVSSLLKAEIEATPGCVRRLLRPRPAKEIVAGLVAQLDRRQRSRNAGRTCRCVPAIRERTRGQRSDDCGPIRNCTQYLETGTKILLDTLRQAGDADRPFRQSQVDAAIRFCRTVFGVRICRPARQSGRGRRADRDGAEIGRA